MKKFIFAATAMLLTSCATPPEKIAAAPTPVGAYSTLDCKALDTELAHVNQQLATASNAQEKAVRGDALGVFFIGVPVSSLTGNDRETEIAVYKGQVDALGQERIRRGCLA